MAAGKNVQEFNDLNFDQEVLKSDVPVLVDFSATWCGPSKAIAPLVGQLADEYAGKVKVGTIDIDDSPGIAQRFGISQSYVSRLIRGALDELRAQLDDPAQEPTPRGGGRRSTEVADDVP